MLETKYNPQKVEQGKYEKWIKEGYFEAGDLSKQPYSIVIPPPNVTGRLHLGHAWDNTLQDILARYHRLLNKDVLYLPGMDHAGIATQAKVVARLKEMGIDYKEIGRDEFLKHSWNWKEEYAETIHHQWSKFGLSLDYTRERFTLDEGLNKAVNEVFVKLYEQGLIFRGKRIINWDPEAMTALSNIEVFHKETKGHFYTFRYPILDSDEVLEVATTRPETMFGDVCVVVHPDDERYQHLVGKKALNPANHQYIDIIADEYVELGFGTGAMKCTPAHDPNDFLIGQKYNLEMPICMNLDGTMNELANEYEGLDRFECRRQLVKKIEEEGNLVEIKEHLHEVGYSERTDVIVEPTLSEQWFVKMEPLAKEVLKLQDSDDKINFYPQRFEKVFTQWLENIEDWTISRQLWWGHRIPAYIHNETGELLVSATEPEDIENWTQDPDVLDTWFSSALWPFSTLGWPEQTQDLERYYPTSVQATGYDIILFWVVRMAFQGLHFMDAKPFNDVIIHGLIRDEIGRKISKSLGNGQDPMDVIDEYGADALRFFLVTNSSPGQDLRYSETKLKSAWNFINKIYNSARYVLMNLGDDFKVEDVDLSNLNLTDEWILAKLNHMNQFYQEHMKQYDFLAIGQELEKFIWNDFCNWYLEFSKTQVGQSTKSTLYVTLISILKMISPFMPFVSEHLYLALPHELESINLDKWPELIEGVKETQEVDELIEVIEAIRETRVDFEIKPKTELFGQLNHEVSTIFKDIIYKMTRFNFVDTIDEDSVVIPLKASVLKINKADLVDLESEILKLEKQIEHYQSEIKRAQGMLANKNFVDRAPATKVDAERQKLEEYQTQLTISQSQLENITSKSK